MPGILFVVGTPIGNLEDITLRALRVLREVQLVAAEDTRRTSKLLRHFEIQTRLISLHGHNEHARIPELVSRLQQGESVALVSDAGTPGISDPGALLVAAARAAQIPIDPIPGPSAITTAISIAGHRDTAFHFAGFPPFKAGELDAWAGRLAVMTEMVIFFEAPHRIRRTLAALAAHLPSRPLLLLRELTKAFQESRSGTATELLDTIPAPRGEYTVVVAPQTDRGPSATIDPDAFEDEVKRWADSGSSLRDGARDIADRLGLRPREVYRRLLAAREPSS